MPDLGQMIDEEVEKVDPIGTTGWVPIEEDEIKKSERAQLREGELVKDIQLLQSGEPVLSINTLKKRALELFAGPVSPELADYILNRTKWDELERDLINNTAPVEIIRKLKERFAMNKKTFESMKKSGGEVDFE